MDTQGLTPGEKRLQQLAARLEETLVDDDGQPAQPDVVEQVVAEKAANLEEAPLQEFVPLLVENQARTELRSRGLKSNLEPERPPHEAG